MVLTASPVARGGSVTELAAASPPLTGSPGPSPLSGRLLPRPKPFSYLSGSLYGVRESVIFHPSADSISRQSAVIRHAAHKGQMEAGGGRLGGFSRVELRRSGKARQERAGDTNVREAAYHAGKLPCLK